ncbi:MAG: hypothetical protein KDC85_09715 [Saprospiraceae bacterium]|nr:hypothetical protein [Saprospiraceae bacterium]MCB9322928.1 hypothetical protein [Lewinellaceae bacterium]
MKITSHNNTIDSILSEYESILGNDFTAYRNHVYRIFNFSMILDDHPENISRYAIAASLHDLGIWTHKTFDYLEPTLNLTKNYLAGAGQQSLEAEILLMIDMHHKMSRYTGPFAQTVEAFRRADWIDVSMGLLKFGVSGEAHRKVKEAFPYKGFHRFLLRQTFKRFLSHPLDPLPMFKK